METIGNNTIGGYDIACSFLATLLNSSLGTKFQRSGSSLCVNAFHGYSHNFACQSIHHPNAIVGIGLEDLETMERIFSMSYQLAGVTRYASKYNRRLFIDMSFKQWDEDKYANLALMLYNNYCQALDTIREVSATLKNAKKSYGISDQDLDMWEASEVQYFQTVGTEPKELSCNVAYVDLLRDYRTARYAGSPAIRTNIDVSTQ